VSYAGRSRADKVGGEVAEHAQRALAQASRTRTRCAGRPARAWRRPSSTSRLSYSIAAWACGVAGGARPTRARRRHERRMIPSRLGSLERCARCSPSSASGSPERFRWRLGRAELLDRDVASRGGPRPEHLSEHLERCFGISPRRVLEANAALDSLQSLSLRHLVEITPRNAVSTRRARALCEEPSRPRRGSSCGTNEQASSPLGFAECVDRLLVPTPGGEDSPRTR